MINTRINRLISSFSHVFSVILECIIFRGYTALISVSISVSCPEFLRSSRQDAGMNTILTGE